MNNVINQLVGIALSNPNYKNNPFAQSLISVIRSGDSVRGEQIANNILREQGMTREQAMQQARQMFRF